MYYVVFATTLILVLLIIAWLLQKQLSLPLKDSNIETFL